MNQHWQHAAEQHNGKHVALVTVMHDAILAAPQTLEGRTQAAFTAFMANANLLVTAGATAEDMFDALEHFVASRPLLLDAIHRGIQA